MYKSYYLSVYETKEGYPFWKKVIQTYKFGLIAITNITQLNYPNAIDIKNN
jgi:hypothetical protein